LFNLHFIQSPHPVLSARLVPKPHRLSTKD
jgi:hypothetical protein